jgi:hypothetical protein
MRLRKKFQKGEIATIIALASMAFILLTTITSTLISKKPQTTSTKAYTSEGTSATSTETKTPTAISSATTTQTGIVCTAHTCAELSCGNRSSTKYWCQIGTNFYSCNSKDSSGKCVDYARIYSANDYCGCYESNITVAPGGCCTISNLCGSGGCKVNGVATKYVRKYPNVSSCTGPYVPCPNNVNWHNEIEGCLETSSCTDTASDGSTQGCDITDQICPGSNGKYNVKKFGTGTTASFQYYPSSDSNCSGNGYKSVDEACKQNITPTKGTGPTTSSTPAKTSTTSTPAKTSKPAPEASTSPPIPLPTLPNVGGNDQECINRFQTPYAYCGSWVGSIFSCTKTDNVGGKIYKYIKYDYVCGIGLFNKDLYCCVREDANSAPEAKNQNLATPIPGNNGDEICRNIFHTDKTYCQFYSGCFKQEAVNGKAVNYIETTARCDHNSIIGKLERYCCLREDICTTCHTFLFTTTNTSQSVVTDNKEKGVLIDISDQKQVFVLDKYSKL